MARTTNVDLDNELRSEKQAESKLEQLRQLIDEGEASGDPLAWNAGEFLKQMKPLNSIKK